MTEKSKQIYDPRLSIVVYRGFKLKIHTDIILTNSGNDD